MTTIERKLYMSNSAGRTELCNTWSAHVDALERHLSANTWALVAVTVLLIAYPVVRVLIPTDIHCIVPHVVRTVLDLM
jgi:hypothetical protein